MRLNTWITPLVVALLTAGSSAAVRASDGRIEINQARAIAGSVTPGDAPGFPVTLDVSGSYVLTSDLSVSNPSLSALSVEASGVSIDLAGFSLVGPRQCSGAGAPVSCDITTDGGNGITWSPLGIDTAMVGLMVHNGTIRGFDAGIGRPLGQNAARCILEDLKISRNSGSGLEFLPSCVISNSLVERNRVLGIRECSGIISNATVVANGSTSGAFLRTSVVRSSTFRSNVGNGLNCWTCLISDAAVQGNTVDGVRARDCSLIVDSSLSENRIQLVNEQGNLGAANVVTRPSASPTSSNVSGTIGELGPNACEGNLGFGACPP